MTGMLDGRVAIVTGAGRGLGRAHALELAGQGAHVVVNDLGTSLDGNGASTDPGQSVVEEIIAGGGSAVSNGADISDFDQAAGLVNQAIDAFGQLDILVNNAGFVRDRMLVNADIDEWEAVIRVHLTGHFATMRHAAAYWRQESKEGRQPDARIINTSSGAGLQGSIGQSAYSAAKGGIASLTIVAAAELARYGVTVNALAPSARTRMTEGPFAAQMAAPEDGFDRMDPANVSPVVAWLASADAADVTGRVIEIGGGALTVEHGWRHGRTIDLERRWDACEVGAAVRELIAEGPAPEPVYGT
ncbi:SDR family oxidoreductase [Salinibacterium sp. ZJ70]|uniref:SDR family oxidoreductase n=1 Tax=Salinibacterium sp. ZJ70 TaxID=2708084 RepID=UPI00142401EB|nr:SDR family oxidoreductase [Salinibacterium sp. ZJ70]